MGFFQSIFSFSGFMDRGDYWKAVVFYVWFPAALMAFFAFLSGWYNFDEVKITINLADDMTALEDVTLILAGYTVFSFTYGMLAIMAKRLRDISISPWLGLLYFILPISPVIVVLYGMFPTNVNSYER